jgi:hypothetical protein
MKKISFALLTILAVSFSSCLKDKGFENQEYGIKDPGNASAPGVGFNLLGTSGYVRNVGLDFSDNPVSIDVSNLTVSYLLGTTPTKDVHFTIALDPTIVADYNTANGTSLVDVDPATFNIASTDVFVPAGQKNAFINVTFPRTSVLDPNTTYGLAFRIVSAEAGYQVAANMNKMLLIINVKNKYDGIYLASASNCTFSDASNATFSGRYPLTYYLITSGPASVNFCLKINGEIFPGYLFNAGGSGSYFGRFGVQCFFDPATDNVSEVRNYYGDPANPATTGGSTAGTGAPLYSSSNGRRATLDPSGVNKYDAATKTIKIKYFMLQPSVVAGGPRCYFDETLVWQSAR